MKRLAAFFVKGRLDHMDVDVKGKRLFVAGLENGTLEVVDLQGAPLRGSSDYLLRLRNGQFVDSWDRYNFGTTEREKERLSGP